MSHHLRRRRIVFAITKAILVSGSVALWPAMAQAPNDIRVALVMGNSAYPGKMALANPVNDAAAMSAALKSLGFTVIEVKNAQRSAMEDGIKKLFNALKGKQGVGMLYFAGHGLQVDWKNYMIPIDAVITQSKDLPGQALDVADVLEAMKAAGSRMNVVVLDACRDNPFAEKGAKGLAPVDAPTGTFLAYATAPGNIAEDGSGVNGLYTKHLLAELQKPVSIEGVFKRVRLNVRKESNGRQIPWESTSLEDDFSFVPQAKVSSVSRGSQRDADFAEQKAQWEKIKDSSNPEDFFSFLTQFPTGLISEIAQARLDRLAKSTVQMQGGKGEDVVGAVTDRLRIGDEWKVRSTTKGVGLFGGSTSWDTHYRVVREVNGNLEVVGKRSGFMMSDQVQTLTPEGAVITNDEGMMGKYESVPPSAIVPSGPFQVGYKSSSRVETVRNGKAQGGFDFDVNVEAREEIDTPMGKRQAYRIGVRHATTGAFGSTMRPYKITTWYERNSLIPLKSLFEMPGTPTTENLTLEIKRASI